MYTVTDLDKYLKHATDWGQSDPYWIERYHEVMAKAPLEELRKHFGSHLRLWKEEDDAMLEKHTCPLCGETYTIDRFKENGTHPRARFPDYTRCYDEVVPGLWYRLLCGLLGESFKKRAWKKYGKLLLGR